MCVCAKRGPRDTFIENSLCSTRYLPVKGDEWDLEELLAHKVERLLDLLRGGAHLLPDAAVMHGVQ